ncbi:hypothetical protein GALMADRAFT_244020 [Galerina marginata CBS 339.88]|uniref:F-box domain-containing protein n=1 Tax=Galerina marginata (strain CBS 339.88) TaxID=685588 RepID=A0A067T628_GALM3|nr:hypothetical protein GALMADRAFT_244020 [Galerina marginata CBS 339.88]
MQPSATTRPPTGSVSVPKGRHDEAPFSKLHRDVLWLIFMKNADMDTTGRCHDLISLPAALSALTTARWSSQVCRHWRDVMLSSSSVWSRCIDLDHLNQEDPRWRDEVLLRTDHLPLHVKGIIATPDEAMFLLSLLDSNWHRIREIEIEIVDDSTVDDVRWDVFLQPAPVVQSVVIAFRYETGIPDILSTPDNTIFADHAPALVRFASSNILFGMPSRRSLPQLRHLELKGKFTAAQLLGALSRMSCLEYLSIHRDLHIDDIPMSIIPHTNVPRLSYILLYGAIGGCLTLLEHITPAPGCSLILDTSGVDWVADMGDRVPEVLFHYAKSFFEFHTASKLDLKIRKNRFSLSCEEMVVHPSDSDSPRLPEFAVDIESITNVGLFPLDSLLYIFSTCRFDKVTTLAIHQLFSEADFDNANFIPFISSLISLETLETTQALFDILFKTDESRLVFPSLKTIIYKFSNTFPSDFMKNFLFRRHELGIPIQELTISPPHFSFYQDMRPLDNLTGLRLKWKQGDVLKEYICGSGNPECLDLAKGLV